MSRDPAEHHREAIDAGPPATEVAPAPKSRRRTRVTIALVALMVVGAAAAYRYHRAATDEAVAPDVERKAEEMRAQIRDYTPPERNVEDSVPPPAKIEESGGKRSEPVKPQ